MSPRPLILHITGDYPDPTRPPTTVAIKTLIDNLTACDQVIVSLTRTADPRRSKVVELPAPPGQRLFAVHHFGLPFGVGLLPAFHRVAGRIERILDDNGLRPDLVHSHRLTFDGLAGAMISKRRGIAHFVSVRGEVESKVLRHKPTYRPLIRRILRSADRIYYVSAWFRPHLERLCPEVRSKAVPLPNIVANTKREIIPVKPDNRIVAVANLDIYEKKGLDRMITAFSRAAPRLPGVSLEIVGRGTPNSVAKLQSLIDTSGAASRIRLTGPMSNSALLESMTRALVMALPSRNETFGMVYTEALFAGVPILYSRDTGIDGHLDGLDVGIGVAANDVDAIADALVRLVEDNARYRAAIASAAPQLFARFDRDRQVAGYLADVAAAVARHSGNGALRASHVPTHDITGAPGRAAGAE